MIRPITILLVTLVLGAPTQAMTLLFDDFDGSSLDLEVWRLPTGPGTFFGRTQIKPPSEAPVVSGGTIVLQLDPIGICICHLWGQTWWDSWVDIGRRGLIRAS